MSDRNTLYQWANLPKELLQKIGKHLDCRIDVYRFRAVCTSWRSSVSPSYRQSTRIPLKLPPPIFADAFLSPVTICRLEQVEDNFSSSSSNSMAWLTKVEESTVGDMQLLMPLSNRQIKALSWPVPKKTLNLLNFRLVELAKACTLKRAKGRPVLGIDKMVPFPNTNLSNDVSSSDFGLFAIFHEGKLGYWRNGDENWNLLDDRNFHYDDIIVYKGQLYVIDRCGTVSWIDSSLNLIQYSPPLYGCGSKKNLVESCGDLYVVDRYLDGERRTWQGNEDEHINQYLLYLVRNYRRSRAKTVDVKVYKLDEDWGTWVDVKTLDDRVFVVGNECCFSFSTKEFDGWDGNFIYFNDPSDEDCRGELSGYVGHVFRLSDRSIGKATHFLGNSQISKLPS